MKDTLETPSAVTEQPQGHEYRPLRLADLPDVLTIRQVCAVLQISERSYRSLRAHGAWPIPALLEHPVRFGKPAVQAFIEQGGAARLRRAS